MWWIVLFNMNQTIKSKPKNKKLNRQSKEIIFNLLNFMEEEAMLNINKKSDNNFLIPMKQVQLRCSKATNVFCKCDNTHNKRS